jgi:hypothetical protein
MEPLAENKILLTPIYVRNAQKRYTSKPEVKERIRAQNTARERIRREDPEYLKLLAKNAREYRLRKKSNLQSINLLLL